MPALLKHCFHPMGSFPVQSGGNGQVPRKTGWRVSIAWPLSSVNPGVFQIRNLILTITRETLTHFRKEEAETCPADHCPRWVSRARMAPTQALPTLFQVPACSQQCEACGQGKLGPRRDLLWLQNVPIHRPLGH